MKRASPPSSSFLLRYNSLKVKLCHRSIRTCIYISVRVLLIGIVNASTNNNLFTQRRLPLYFNYLIKKERTVKVPTNFRSDPPAVTPFTARRWTNFNRVLRFVSISAPGLFSFRELEKKSFETKTRSCNSPILLNLED